MEKQPISTIFFGFLGNYAVLSPFLPNFPGFSRFFHGSIHPISLAKAPFTAGKSASFYMPPSLRVHRASVFF